MEIHYLQHVPFEGPGYIADWAAAREYPLSGSKLYDSDSSPPEVDEFDWLIILGGPMNVDEVRKYPWLIAEKQLVKSAIEAGKVVFGICLGAQLIARVLGAEVFPGKHREIGWFPVKLHNQAGGANAFKSIPGEFTAFHWHGDTFDLPPQVLPLAYSEGCENQAFIYGQNTLGLQFHLEATPESVRKLVDNCGSEIIPGKYIQKKEKILSAPDTLFSAANKKLETILDNLAR